MFGLHIAKGGKRIIAVADVGSGSAGFAIVEAHPGGLTTVHAAGRSILPLEDRSREQIKTGVLRMLSEAGADVLKAYVESPAGKHLGPPREIHVIIRAPWTRASAGRATKKFAEETVITKTMITDLAREAFEGNEDLDRANALETSVIRVELNEYPIATPIGKKAHRLDIVTFQSDCDPIIKKGISTALEKLFPGREPVLHSGARAYLSMVQERLDHPDEYVIVDMVSEATSVMAVRGGVITHHAIIPEGVRTILRRVSGTKGIPEEVSNLLRMVVAGSCSGSACDTLNEALARIEPELVRVFGEAVGGVMGKMRLPDTLILFVHPDFSEWLTHVLSRIDFAQFTIPLQPFTVDTTNAEKLRAAGNVESQSSVDAGIIVASAFVNM